MQRISRLTLLFSGLLLSGLCVPGTALLKDPTLRLLLETSAPLRIQEPGDRPNVLFVIVDDLNTALGSYLKPGLRPQHASAKTPHLDQLAAQGVRFENAFVQNPLCNQSRTSFLSGLRPATTEVYDQTWPRHKIGDGLRMLPEHFDDHGYFTARVGKVMHNSQEHALSWDVSSGRRDTVTQWSPLEGDGVILAELYDLDQDPMEFVNLADEPSQAVLVSELSRRLLMGWQEALPPRLAE